ncbi:UNVERIFIED_CONTAM: hypothetical protein Slati_3735900 [Sesamum latifolium]|uniref:Transposase n=1 Tax=Sesamum latifolium TaxID=2727402 RepID=A0AAW2U3P1_9LAMI
MYNKNLPGMAGLTPEFEDGVKTFIEWAKGQRGHMDGDKIRCPCRKYKNTKFRTPDEVSYHLCNTAEYYNWTSHGEESVPEYFVAATVPPVSAEPTPAAHVEANNHPNWGDEQYMRTAQRMVFMQPVRVNFLLLMMVCKMMVRGDYYSTKKLIKDLGLPIEKIGACKNGCILYRKDDVDLEYCKFCGDARYKPTRGQDPRWKKSPFAVLRYLPLNPHLQRLYSSRSTAEHMTWHATHQTERGRCVIHLMPRHGSILTRCIPILQKSRVMFGLAFAQTVLRRMRLIDVYLEPLIEELLQLWHVGVRTYNHATENKFIMQAALMWTVNDLLAYGMASRWSTAGVMGCPICMDDTRVFHLQHEIDLNCLSGDAFRACMERPNRAFFDSMEHLIVHLPYEARVEAPMQYRWMYQFEMFLPKLKKKVENKAHDEVSIVEAYIIEEIGLFTSQYFESAVQSKRTMPRRNDERTNNDHGIQVSIFNYPGRASGAPKKRWLIGPERHIIETYILTNCEVVTPYYEEVVHPMLNNIENELLKSYYRGPSAEVTPVICYFVNGYNFQTKRHNTDKSTMNCVKARRVVDESKWTEICTYQSDAVLPVPIVGTDNQTYNLRYPNGLQVMVDNQAAGTSRSQARQTDDDNEDNDEDSFEDDDTDDDEYELT